MYGLKPEVDKENVRVGADTEQHKESGGTTHSRSRTDAALTIFVWRAHEQPDGPGEGGSVGGAGGEVGGGGRGAAGESRTEWGLSGEATAARQDEQYGCLAVRKGRSRRRLKRSVWRQRRAETRNNRRVSVRLV